MLLLLIVKVTFKTTTFKQTFKIYQNKFVAVLIFLELFFCSKLTKCFPIASQVCEGLIHFARRENGTTQPSPDFPGLRGPEVSRSLLEVEATFIKNLQVLKNVRHTILDVKVIYLFF